MSQEVDHIGQYLSAMVLSSKEYSDVTIEAFGNQFPLHRVILARSPFFARLFSNAWNGGGDAGARQTLYTVGFDDGFITETSFNLAINHLYGKSVQKGTDLAVSDLVGLVAIANFLSLPDLEAKCSSILKDLTSPTTLATIVTIFFENNYGSTSTAVLKNATNYLKLEGYRLSSQVWAELPPSLVYDVLNSDEFFCPSEEARIDFVYALYDYIVSYDEGSSQEGEGAAEEESDHVAENSGPSPEFDSCLEKRSYQTCRTKLDEDGHVSILPFASLPPSDRYILVDTMAHIADERLFFCHVSDEKIVDTDKRTPLSLPAHCLAKIKLRVEVERAGRSGKKLLGLRYASECATSWEVAGVASTKYRSEVPPFRFAVEVLPSCLDSSCPVTKPVWYGGSLWLPNIQRNKEGNLSIFLKRLRPAEDSCESSPGRDNWTQSASLSRSGPGAISSQGRMSQQEAVATAAVTAAVGRTSSSSSEINGSCPEKFVPPYFDVRDTAAGRFSMVVGCKTKDGYKLESFRCGKDVDFLMDKSWGPPKGSFAFIEEDGWANSNTPLKCIFNLSLV